METVQCYCSQCKTEDTRQEMGAAYVRFNNLFEMWKRLNWLYKGTSLGCGVKFVFSDDNKPLYTHVWNDTKAKTQAALHAEGTYLPYAVFNASVKADVSVAMGKLNEFRNEYLGLQKLYNEAKYYRSTYDTVSVVGETGDSVLQCACGNDDIFVISPHGHLDHLGITSEDVAAEFETEYNTSNGLYSDDGYDYSTDGILNKEIKREYSDHTLYNDTVKAHRAEAEFYAIADSMTIGQACKKLGKAKSNMIADQIAEYYSTKMSL